MDYELTQHARDVLAERKIALPWVERVWRNPAQVIPSATDPEIESRFAVIPEFSGRVLRTVVNKQASPERIVSVYFDRSMKGKQ